MFKNTPQGFLEFAPKDLTFGEDARLLMLKAAEKQAKAVGSTMGPAGKFTVFESIDQIFPKATKDGVTVSKQVIPLNECERMAAALIMQAADKQVKQSGDGTTLTTILVYHILKRGLQQLDTGKTLKYIDKSIRETIARLQEISNPIKELEELIQVATISANGDEQLGGLIGEAVWRAGEFGIVDHRVHDSLVHEIEYQDGYHINQGFMFLQSQNTKQGVEYDDCLVLVCAEAIKFSKELQPLITCLDQFYGPQEGVAVPPLVIVCPELSGDIPSNLLSLMHPNIGMKICWVKPEGIATAKEYCLKDICSISGANMVSDETGLQMRHIKITDLGTLKKFKANTDSSILYSHDTEAKKERISLIESLKDQTTDKFLKGIINKSLAKLHGSIAIIKVGGNNESSQKETQDRVDDAILACRSAKEEGILSGGGVALLKISKEIDGWMSEVLQEPIRQILNNAHINPEEIIKSITGNWKFIDKVKCAWEHGYNKWLIDLEGYNIDTEKATYISMESMGIIDPTKVIRTALINAADIAKLMLNTEVLITISEEYKEQMRRH